jgi:hypothetical protein
MGSSGRWQPKEAVRAIIIDMKKMRMALLSAGKRSKGPFKQNGPKEKRVSFRTLNEVHGLRRERFLRGLSLNASNASLGRFCSKRLTD